MIRLTLIDDQGKPITPQDLSATADLREAAEQARALIRECERLADQKSTKKKGAVPYL
jgi:hypothetical protein